MEIRQYIAIGLKWWWLLILSTVVAAAIGYALSQRQTPVYQAATTLMIGESLIQTSNVNNSDFNTSQLLAQTYADMAKRRPVLQGVIETLDLAGSWRDLEGRVQSRPVRGTQLIEITVEASSPEEAQVTADEVARQLILLSPTARENQEKNENRQFVRQRLADLKAKIEGGQARLKTLETTLSGGSLSAEQVQELQTEIDTVEGLLRDWEANYAQLLISAEGAISVNALTIIEPAEANPQPVRPNVQQSTILAGLLGLGLALGLIFLLEHLDDTLKSASELSQELGLTALGTISRIEGKHYPDKLITSQDFFSPISEAYRMIRGNIQFMSIDQPARSIMVTSPTPSEGKSTTAANLGVVMAQAGLKTIIVDADLRRPTQHQIFQVPNLGGLTDLLRSPQPELNGHLRKTSVENLYLIPSGALPPNPSELLGSQRMGRLVASLAELADVVIYDSPPALAVADATVLSNQVDGVVLVTQAGQTRRDAARQAIENLQQANAHLLGGILNRASRKGGNYYYYHYYTSKGSRSTGQSAPVNQRRRWQWLPFFKS
jgi:capsular exopolysaccharide synthesis family protein